jgi:hypothetical protein
MLIKVGGKEITMATGGYYIGEPAEEGSFLDKFNDFSEWAVNKEMEIIFEPIAKAFIHAVSTLIEAIYLHLPEIGGALTIIFGILIMVTGNFPKWITRYGFLMTGVILWLVYGQ